MLYEVITTSSGFDGLNFLLLTGVFFRLISFLQEPSEKNLSYFLFLSAVAGYGRYESALVFFLAALFTIIYLVKYEIVPGENFHRWLSLSTPVWVVPLVWQRLFSGHLANAGDSDSIAIGLKYVRNNFV